MISSLNLSSGSFTLHPHIHTSLHEWVDAARRAVAPPTTKDLHGIDKSTFETSSKSDVMAELATGALLCQLVNVLHPGMIQRVHGNNPSVYGQLDNLGQLLLAFKSMGIEYSFQPRDVVTGRSMLEFVGSILAFAQYAYNQSPTMPNPPPVFSTADLKSMHSFHSSTASLPGMKSSQAGAPGFTSGPDLSVLTSRMSLIEEQQHRLMEMMAGVERMTAMTQRSLDQLVSGLLDAFTDIQSLRGMSGSMQSAPSTATVLAQAAEAFPSTTALGYASAASMNGIQAYNPEPRPVNKNISSTESGHRTEGRQPQAFPAGFDIQTSLPPAPALPIDIAAPPSSRAHAQTVSHVPVRSLMLQDPGLTTPATFPRYATSTLRSMDTIQYLPDDDDLPPVTSLDNLDGCRSGAQSVLDGRITASDAFDADDEQTINLSPRGSQRLAVEGQDRRRESTLDDAISAHTVANTVRSADRKSISELLALKAELSARLPTAVLDACTTRIDLLRQSAVYELIETERDFVRDMSVVVEVVKPWVSQRVLELSHDKPDESGSSTTTLTRCVDAMFGNMEQMLENHVKIMDLMNEQVDKSPVIEGIELVVQEMIPLLDVHVSYATHYSKEIIPVLKLAEMAPISQEVAQLPETNRQSLDSLLIKPIQRVSKYPLLIGEIRKHSFENAPHYKLLESALTCAQQLLEKVNSNSASPSQATSAQLAVFSKTISGFHGLDLSPDCEFIREGTAWRWSSGKLTPVHWILFGELLLVCKPSSARSLRKKYDILSSLVPVKLVVVPTGAISAHPNLFPIDLLPVGDEHEGVSESGSLAAWVVSGATGGSGGADKLPVMTFAFDSTEERGAWMRALEKALGVEIAKGKSGVSGSSGGLVRKRSKKSSWISGGKKALSPGPNFSLHAGLPKSPISPHDLPDNCEILVRTLDAHTPTTRFELGFAKSTYLRVVNQDHDFWKVSMNRMCGLVSKSLVTKVETDSSRYSHLIQACQSEMALTWIDCPGDCTVSMRRTAIVGNESALLESVINKRHSRSASMGSVASRVSELIGEVVTSRGSGKSKSSDQELSDKSPPPRPTSASSERSAHRGGGHRRTSSIASKQARLSKRQGSKASSTDGLGGGLFSEPNSISKHTVLPVEGRSEWRQVIPANGDKPYYYNVETRQSVWVLAAGDSGTVAAASGTSRSETPVRLG